MSNKKKTILIVALLLVVFIGSISYALWSVTLEQTDSNVVKTGCFTVDMVEQTDEINLPEEYPVTDAEGRKSSPFTFTIQNTCTIDSSYSVNLKVEDGTTLEHQYVKAVLDGDKAQVLTDYEKATDEDKYQLTTGTLAGASSEGAGDGESITYDLRLWLDQDTPKTQMSKDFYAKIVIENITTTISSKVLATGDISATDADNVTYTFYDSGLLTIDGTGATMDFEGEGDNIFSMIIQNVFEKECSSKGVDSEMFIGSVGAFIATLKDIYVSNDSLIDALLESGDATQDDLDQLGIKDDVDVLNVMLGIEVNDKEYFSQCLDILKNMNVSFNSVELSGDLTYLGNYIFGGTELKNILDLSSSDLALPETLVELGRYSFSNTNFNSIILNEGLISGGHGAFYRAKNIVNIPSTLILDDQIFRGASFKNEVNLDGFLKVGDSVFWEATFEKGINLGTSIKEIGYGAFLAANLSGELIIPNSVEKIASSAFSDTSISALKLPENFSYVGMSSSNDFPICGNCVNLTQVEIPLSVKVIQYENADLIWGRTAPNNAKYIMPIKESEYGQYYRIYEYNINGNRELGVIYELSNSVKIEWQPE